MSKGACNICLITSNIYDEPVLWCPNKTKLIIFLHNFLLAFANNLFFFKKFFSITICSRWMR